eukprot:CAMPEP_0113967052 /NCGR_PEP_ID=MMETSP0011_2-20120614/8686_1 /TAXON_ID=101924 /ORGANISM="Rhodosorus marinus" /LENGTH=1177 /DNA_ID=CAMNT_0000979833 /DNA_START=465 /DNA_END=3998 /DNA_ORIENTATION=+ /assembly_acc=CAM_ASM_000156
MPEGEIEVAVEDGPPKDAEEKGTRRSKRDRKRRNHDFDPFPEKKMSPRASRSGQAQQKASFVDMNLSDTSGTERRRKLLERLNQISAERAKLDRLEKDREYVQNLREQAMSNRTGSSTQKNNSTVKSASKGRHAHSPRLSASGSSSPRSTSASPVQEIEFSMDLKRRQSAIDAGMESPDLNAMSQAARAKRQRTPSVLLKTQPGEMQIVPTPGSRSRQYQFCYRLAKEFARHKDGVSFSKPVTELWKPEAIPGYHDIVKKPMDLGTVMRKMESGAYGHEYTQSGKQGDNFNVEMWAEDMRLIFSNAISYNRAGDQIHDAAKSLLAKLEQKLFEMPGKGEENVTKKGSPKNKSGKGADRKHSKHSHHHKKRSHRAADGEDAGKTKPKRQRSQKAVSKADADEESAEDETERTARDVERKLEEVQRQMSILRAMSSPLASPRTPTYAIHAAAMYHVPMSYEEKRKLGENINKLPGEKLGKLIEIVAKRTGKAEMNKDEEIELDIDAMDNKTLREMEAFVNSVVGRKKAASKQPSITIPQGNAEIKRLEALLARRKADERQTAKDGGLTLDLDSSSSSSGSSNSGDSSSSGDSDGSGGQVEDVLLKRQQRELAYRQMTQSAASPFPLSSRPLSSPHAASPSSLQRQFSRSPTSMYRTTSYSRAAMPQTVVGEDKAETQTSPEPRAASRPESVDASFKLGESQKEQADASFGAKFEDMKDETALQTQSLEESKSTIEKMESESEPPASSSRVEPGALAPAAEPITKEREVAERDVAGREAAEMDVAERDAAERDVAERDVAERDDAERDDAERDDAERDVAERDATERDATERDATERDATERDATERDEAERDATDRDAADRDVAERDATERDATERDATERDEAERDATDRDAADRDVAEREATDPDAAEREATDPDAAERDTAERDAAERDAADRDAADPDAAERDGPAENADVQGSAVAGMEYNRKSADEEDGLKEAVLDGDNVDNGVNNHESSEKVSNYEAVTSTTADEGVTNERCQPPAPSAQTQEAPGKAEMSDMISIQDPRGEENSVQGPTSRNGKDAGGEAKTTGPTVDEGKPPVSPVSKTDPELSTSATHEPSQKGIQNEKGSLGSSRGTSGAAEESKSMGGSNTKGAEPITFRGNGGEPAESALDEQKAAESTRDDQRNAAEGMLQLFDR